MAKSKIGVMGGSFDPIHNGHLVAASEVAARLGLDHVVFVPAGDQWQKEITTAAEDRYLMTVIATAENPMFSVSRIDIDRDGPTYTVDTLGQVHQEFPEAELYFIIGADAVAGINTWNNPEKLMELANFIAVSRPGHKIEMPFEPAGPIQTLEIPALAISSTDCRERVRNNLPLWYLVPDGVVRFIQKNNLYKELQ